MSEELDQQAVDAAIILENRVNERIKTAVRHEVKELVLQEVSRLLRDHKGAMLMEITTSINQMLRGFIEQERKPLWESTPEELGLSREDLTRHMMNQRSEQ
jgi:predicted transcriptional regulator